MIRSNELRIGNIVKVNNPTWWPKLKDVPMVISGISPNYSENKKRISISVDPLSAERALHYGTVSQFDQYIEPIPLTEEILTKCGFEKIKSDYEAAETFDFRNGILHFYMANQTTKISGSYALGFIPEYLHQLQNLYFALTGEELKITL